MVIVQGLLDVKSNAAEQNHQNFPTAINEETVKIFATLDESLDFASATLLHAWACNSCVYNSMKILSVQT